MKKRMFAGLAAMGLSMSAFAALPGSGDSIWQMKTIFDSPQVAEVFRSDFIDSVTYQGHNAEGERLWRLRTRRCEFDVTLQALPMPITEDGIPMVGRVDYAVTSVTRIAERCQH